MKTRIIKAVLCISLSVMCMFTCVGYAAFSSGMTVQGSVESTPPYAVFITSITDGNSVADGQATVNGCIDTIVTFSVNLGDDSTSAKTLSVNVLNNTLTTMPSRAFNIL